MDAEPRLEAGLAHPHRQDRRDADRSRDAAEIQVVLRPLADESPEVHPSESCGSDAWVAEPETQARPHCRADHLADAGQNQAIRPGHWDGFSERSVGRVESLRKHRTDHLLADLQKPAVGHWRSEGE